MNFGFSRAQGSLEYLLVIGLAILISALIITFLPGLMNGPSASIPVVNNAYGALRGELGPGGITFLSVSENPNVGSGVVSIGNNTGSGFVVYSVSSAADPSRVYFGSMGVGSWYGYMDGYGYGYWEDSPAFAGAGGSVDITLGGSYASDCPCGSICNLIVSTSAGSQVIGMNVVCNNPLGSAGNPIVVDDCGGLQNVGLHLDSFFVLGRDIDCGGFGNFVPIGTSGSPFAGNFDGRGFTISNLTIAPQANESAGLFGTAGAGSVIRNVVLNVSGVSLQGASGESGGKRGVSFAGETCTGALVGSLSDGNVVNNKVRSMNPLVGRSTDAGVGGLVGCMGAGSVVSNSSSSSVVAPLAVNDGGLVGKNTGGAISDCNASGSVTADGLNNVGGLVGLESGGSIISSFSTALVLGASNVGGLVGFIEGSSVSDSNASGSVSGVTSVGGLVGSASSAPISGSNSSGSVSGTSSVGGLAGYFATSSILHSFSYSNVTAPIGSSDIGGLVGFGAYADITDSNAFGFVHAFPIGSTNVGGLVGHQSRGTTKRCYSSGQVVGEQNVGSLVGALIKGAVVDSNASGSCLGGNGSACGFIGFAIQ